MKAVRMPVALYLFFYLLSEFKQDSQSWDYIFKIHFFKSILQLGKGPGTASCSFEYSFIVDGVLRYPAALLGSVLRSRCKL